MSKIVNFENERNRLEGIITPEILHESMGRAIVEEDVKSIVTIYRLEDGQIILGYTNMSTIELLGMFEMAKICALEDAEIL